MRNVCFPFRCLSNHDGFNLPPWARHVFPRRGSTGWFTSGLLTTGAAAESGLCAANRQLLWKTVLRVHLRRVLVERLIDGNAVGAGDPLQIGGCPYSKALVGCNRGWVAGGTLQGSGAWPLA